MKRTLLSLLIVTLIVAGTAFGAAYWLRCRSCAAPAAPDWRRTLDLTESQAAAVAQLEAEYQRRLGEICAAHCAARADLARELGQPTPDPATASDCCQRMCAAQSASERLTLEHVLKVRALLTPEQQQRHAAQISQQLTGACPMRVHRP